MANKYTNYDPKIEYWATLPIEDLLPVLMDKIEDYYKTIDGNGLLRLWQDSYNVYYGLSQDSGAHESSKVTFVGDNDAGIKVRSGHMANILQHIHISATGQEPTFIPRAVNNDAKSKAQTYAAKSILDYLLYEKDYVSEFKDAADSALCFSVGYIYQGWDLIENDLFLEAHTPLTIVRDLKNKHSRNPLWYIVVQRVNKWDIVSKYRVPEEDIPELESENPNKNYFVGFENVFEDDEDGDYINVYHLFHRRTPALPNGRYVAFVNSKVALYPAKGKKDDLPYAELPVYQMYPRTMLASPYNYTVAFDLVAHDTLHNIALSTIHTQVNKYGKKILAGPIGKKYENIGSLEYLGIPAGERPPAILDFTPISETLFALMKVEQQQMEVLSAVNSALRGESTDQKSGSHAALMHSVAVQFQSGFHQSYQKLLQRCGTGLLRLIKEFSTQEKMIEIVGADGEAYLQAFSKDNISNIDRVIVEAGNPMLKTTAGKLHLADSMLERGIITSPNEYQDVLDTGQLQGVLTPGRHKNSGIQSENELLMKPEELTIEEVELKAPDGTVHVVEVVREVRALIVDDDPTHIEGHASILLNPTMRQNPLLVRVALVHIAEHVWNAKYGSPDLIIALGKKPFPTTEQQPQVNAPPKPTANKTNPIAAIAKKNVGQPGQPIGSVPDENYPVSGMPSMPEMPTPM